MEMLIYIDKQLSINLIILNNYVNFHKRMRRKHKQIF